MDLSQVILARKPVNSSFIQEVILIFLCCHFGLSCGLDDWCSLYLQCLHFYYSMTLTNVSWQSCLIKYRSVPFGAGKRGGPQSLVRGDTWNRDDVSEWKMARKWQMLQMQLSHQRSLITDHHRKYNNNEKAWNIARITTVWYRGEMLLENGTNRLCSMQGHHKPFNLSKMQVWEA